jgi:hypothetical protein
VERPTLPEGLVSGLRADPARAPEHLALAAAQRHGPAAAAWVAERRRESAATPRDLAVMAKRRHATMAGLGGAATGVGGFVTVIPDLVLLAWIQSRMVFFIAAAYGFDPLDPMRPAELLVLQELYPDAESARAALDGAGPLLAGAWFDKRIGRDETLVLRLARMAGKRTAAKYATKLVPFVSVAFNAVGNQRDTRALAARAMRFYGG